MTTRKCKFCGGEFSNRIATAIYCSKKCKASACYQNTTKEAKIKYSKKAKERRSRNILSRCLVSFNKCHECDISFVSQRPKIYCSDRCMKNRRARVVRESLAVSYVASVCKCKACGIEFKTSYGDKRREFCSRKCLRRDARRRVSKTHKSRADHFGVRYEYVDKNKVFERDLWTCQICGDHTPHELVGTINDSAPELDHIYPISKGGGHVYDNLQCLCRYCNRIKGDRFYIGLRPPEKVHDF